MRVACLPHFDIYTGNPYWDVLRIALERRSVTFVRTPDLRFLQWRWLIAHRADTDVIHLHHLEHHYAKSAERASFVRLARFVLKLMMARLLAYRLVWTLHNLHPHERLRPHAVGSLAHLAVAQLSSSVIVHCQHARQQVQRRYLRRRGIVVVPHPSFVGVYDDEVTQQVARARLGLPEQAVVYLFFGTLRPYKGIERLIRSMKDLGREDARLLVVGKPWDAALLRGLEAMASQDERITLVPQHVADDEVQVYYNAASAVVLPFRKVLTSSSTVLAMSFGKPVVAPSIGCLPELVTPDSGILYDPDDAFGLTNALKALAVADQEAMGIAARERAAELDWAVVAERTLEAYGQSPGGL